MHAPCLSHCWLNDVYTLCMVEPGDGWKCLILHPLLMLDHWYCMAQNWTYVCALPSFVQSERSLMLHFHHSGWTCSWRSQVSERSIWLQDLGRTFPHWIYLIISNPSEEKASISVEFFVHFLSCLWRTHTVFPNSPEYGTGGMIPPFGVVWSAETCCSYPSWLPQILTWLIFVALTQQKLWRFIFMHHEVTHDVTMYILIQFKFENVAYRDCYSSVYRIIIEYWIIVWCMILHFCISHTAYLSLFQLLEKLSSLFPPNHRRPRFWHGIFVIYLMK